VSQDLEARIERLESLHEIRQLQARYSFALDTRDLDALVNLFEEDVQVSTDRRGRAELKRWFDEMLRRMFDGTSHHIGTYIIDFDSPDEAHGIVYSKNEHETGGEWVIMQMVYWDHYVRSDGRWYFHRRLPCYWYATDLNKPPIGQRKMRWPGREPYEGGWHDLMPSYRKFLDNPISELPSVAEPAPLDQFLERMRRGAPLPRVRVD